jgi:hypothetical protein
MDDYLNRVELSSKFERFHASARLFYPERDLPSPHFYHTSSIPFSSLFHPALVL